MATDTRNPTSEVSVGSGWSGTNRYLLLDDYPDSGNPINDGSTCTIVGALLLGFTAFSVPANSTSISIQVNYYDFKNGSQASAIGASIRCNDTTNRNAATHNPGNGNANIAQRTDNYATNPKSGAAWTVDDVNGVGTNGLTAFGVNCSDASPSVTVSCVQLQVTYTPPVTGDLASTESADSASASGTVSWLANLAATEGTDTAAASGTVGSSGITGTMAGTEAADTGSASGTINWIATLAATEATDTAASTGTVAWIGALAATEGADTLSASGTVTLPGVTGTLAVTESADATAESGTVAWVGTLAAVEAADAAAASGAVSWIGTLAATETADTFGSSGIANWIAVLAATEATDRAFFTNVAGPLNNPIGGAGIRNGISQCIGVGIG